MWDHIKNTVTYKLISPLSFGTSPFIQAKNAFHSNMRKKITNNSNLELAKVWEWLFQSFHFVAAFSRDRVVATNKIPPYFERGRVAAVPQPPNNPKCMPPNNLQCNP